MFSFSIDNCGIGHILTLSLRITEQSLRAEPKPILTNFAGWRQGLGRKDYLVQVAVAGEASTGYNGDRRE